MNKTLQKQAILSLLLILSISSFSQQDSLISHTITPNEDFYYTEDPDFMVTEVPEKWQNESAVILCRKFNYSYIKKKNLHDHEQIRTRIKLQNKNAIIHFSDFYFPYTQNSHFGIRITKANGTTKLVDLSGSEIVQKKTVPAFYASANYSKYKKVKVPGLEIGDIVDYQYVRKNEYHLYIDRSTAALKHILSNPYPIVKQRYDIEFTDGLVFVGRTFNLADTLIETEPHKHKKSEIKHLTQDFSYEDLDREKSNLEIWEFPSAEEPSIKIQIRFPTYDPIESKLLVDESFIINKPYNLQLIQEKEIMKTQIMTYSGDKESVIKRLKKERESYHSDTDFTKEIYYRLRDNYTRGKIQRMDGIDLTGYTYTVDDVYFTNTISLVLTRLKIPHKLVVAAKRTTPNLNNVVFFNEMSRAIKVEDTYFFPFTNFTTHDHIPEYLLGAEAIEFDYQYPFKMKELPPIEKTVLPSKSYSQNLITNEFTIVVEKNFQQLNTTVLRTFEGLSKAPNTGTAVYQFNYLNSRNSSEAYLLEEETQSENLSANTLINKNQSEEEKKAKWTKKLAYFKKQQEADFRVDEYDHFDLISVGREEENPKLVYEEQFTISGLINPRENHFEFEIGKLIGSQLKLQKEDRNRESNIHLDYAKGFHNTYLITFPAGYTISNLENLNTEIKNDMGLFSSEATLHKNVLRLTIKKHFAAQDADATAWPNFVNLMDAAYDFSQKKINITK